MYKQNKAIEWLTSKPLNLDKLDKACNFNQGTCWKLREGVLKGKKHLPILIEYFEKEMKF